MSTARRKRGDCPRGANALGQFPDVLSILNVARNSPSARENARTAGGFVAIRFASDALKRIYAEIDRRTKWPDAGWLGLR